MTIGGTPSAKWICICRKIILTLYRFCIIRRSLTAMWLCAAAGGWFFEDTPEAQDEKVLAREVGRIRMSLEAAGAREKIVFLHYPPVTTGNACAPIVELLKQYGVQKCYYGHLHGAAARFAF